MPEPPLDHWKALIQQRAVSLGAALAADAIEELAGHLADVYVAALDEGRTEIEAYQSAMCILKRSTFLDLSGRQRGRWAMPSRLDARTSNGVRRWWADMVCWVRRPASSARS